MSSGDTKVVQTNLANFEINMALMDIQVLKTAIIRQIDQLQSEEALREVDRFLHALAADNTSQPASDTREDAVEKADEVFAKAVEKYHTLLQKLAQ